jgi:hypothetical protein|tara:strand:+ start:1593 stop:1769 length:177 start_codon:yes stop_codon:yes gene_type:complete
MIFPTSSISLRKSQKAEKYVKQNGSLIHQKKVGTESGPDHHPNTVTENLLDRPFVDID